MQKPSIIPNNLRKIRKSHPNKALRSGNEIAKLLETSPQYYYDLETGRNNCRLNIDHINKLTKIFNVTADEMLGIVHTERDSKNEAMFLNSYRLLSDIQKHLVDVLMQTMLESK